MKKPIVSIFALFIGTIGFAQVSPFTFGPLVGFNQSQLVTDLDTYKENAKLGLQGGLFARLTIKKFILQPEAVIGAKRNEIDFSYQPSSSPSASSVNATQAVNFTSLDVPVMFGRQLLDIPLLKLRVMAGPVASFILNESVEITSNDGVNSSIPDKDLVDLKDQANWSAQAGIGVDVFKVTLDARYNLGLSDMAQNFNLRNNMWTISVGWKIL